ncbi:MAG: hypothetical protein DHS20C20_05030 [Ardenticatenaceae bacterium]|nr:MAG: hypothetical protein DHS20C20_05030 [Ardenticatenaceae bacterium]
MSNQVGNCLHKSSALTVILNLKFLKGHLHFFAIGIGTVRKQGPHLGECGWAFSGVLLRVVEHAQLISAGKVSPANAIHGIA